MNSRKWNIWFCAPLCVCVDFQMCFIWSATDAYICTKCSLWVWFFFFLFCRCKFSLCLVGTFDGVQIMQSKVIRVNANVVVLIWIELNVLHFVPAIYGFIFQLNVNLVRSADDSDWNISSSWRGEKKHFFIEKKKSNSTWMRLTTYPINFHALYFLGCLIMHRVSKLFLLRL